MKIDKLIKRKALPSFCTSNFDVLKTIIFFCKINRLPCLVECTSNQVNQNGGYTKNTPKSFMNKIIKISKNLKFKNLFLGGDHLGPLPWKNTSKKIALKNSIKLIRDFLKQKYCKIHIDTSIKCKDDKVINNEIIFERTKEILETPSIKKKLKGKFLIIGTEVPLSGSGDEKKMTITSERQIKDECDQFKDVLKELKLKNKKFGLVIEPGMKYMHSTVVVPKFKKFYIKKKISKEENFVFEAHSTDFQSQQILSKLVHNNFKFLKVGPELTLNYSKAIFFMHQIEKKLFKTNHSNIKKVILNSMLNNPKYWKDYYNRKNKNLYLTSKLDRMRYYLHTNSVIKSINLLKKNINKITLEKNFSLFNQINKKEFFRYRKNKLSNFEMIKLIFITKVLKKYFTACGFTIN